MFKKNQLVYVSRLHAHGRILEVRPPGSLRVAVGSVVFECQPSDLQLIDEKRPAKDLQIGRKKRQERGKRVKTASRRDRIDLHGFTVADALVAVEKAVDRALFEDRISRLEIVHGVGGGKLKSAIHRYLSALGVVSFKADIANPGVTWVYFD